MVSHHSAPNLLRKRLHASLFSMLQHILLIFNLFPTDPYTFIARHDIGSGIIKVILHGTDLEWNY
jgi:hypothetical protein